MLRILAAECKNIPPSSLEELGRTLLVRNAERMLRSGLALVDYRKFESALEARAGRGAKQDLLALCPRKGR